VFKQIFPEWRLDYLEDHLVDLENLRLTREISSSLQTMGMVKGLDIFGNILSTRGISFVGFLFLRESPPKLMNLFS
jgi:hypothetical protein